MDRGLLQSGGLSFNTQDGSAVNDLLQLLLNNDPRAAQLIKQDAQQGRTGAIATALATASATVRLLPGPWMESPSTSVRLERQPIACREMP